MSRVGLSKDGPGHRDAVPLSTAFSCLGRSLERAGLRNLHDSLSDGAKDTESAPMLDSTNLWQEAYDIILNSAKGWVN